MAEMFAFLVVVSVTVLVVKILIKTLPGNLASVMRNRIVFLIILALVIKLTVVLFWYLNAGHSLYVYADGSTRDSGYFDWSGRLLANYFSQGRFFDPELLHLYGESIGFPYYVGIIYTLFGHHQIMVSIFNTLLSVILALLMFHIVLSLFSDQRIAFWTLAFNLFYPHYISQSYYILKDMLLLFLMVVFGWSIINIGINIGRNRTYLLNYFAVFLATLGIYFVRSQLAIILIGVGGLHLLTGFGLGERKVIKALFFLLICITLMITFGSLSPRGRSTFEKIEDFYIGQKGYRGEATPHYLEGATGPKDIILRIVSNPASASKDFVKSLVFIYWGPTYFYQRSGANLFYAYGKFVFWENLGAIMRIFLMPMVIYGFFHCLRERKVETFLLYGFVALWTFVMMLTGSDERWSMNLIPFLLFFGAVGVVNFDRIKPFYILYILAFNLFIVANITLYQNLIVAKPLAILTFITILWGLLRYRHRIIM